MKIKLKTITKFSNHNQNNRNSFNTNNYLTNQLLNNKTKIPKLDKTRAHLNQNCSETNCKTSYIGQTERKFSVRINEHFRLFNYNVDPQYTFSKHIVEHNHNFNYKPLKNNFYIFIKKIKK